MIFVNQVRTKLNFRGMSREEAAGGNAQKFYMDTRVELKLDARLEKKMQTSEGEQSIQYGANVTAWSIKNKYGPCFVPVTLTILYGKGISNIYAYKKWMESKGMITQGGGGWFEISYKGNKTKERGEPAVLRWVKEHTKEIRETIESEGGFVLLTEGDDSGA